MQPFDTWQQDSEFKALPDSEKADIYLNYFDNKMADDEFNDLPFHEQKQIRSNFLNNFGLQYETEIPTTVNRIPKLRSYSLTYALDVPVDIQEGAGMVSPGNIDLNNRTVVQNEDGTVSTERSISIGTEAGEVLIPTVINGQVVSDQNAINHYLNTGEHLGIFEDIDSATKYADRIHRRFEKPQFQEEPIYDEMGLPVGEPRILGEAIDIPFKPGRAIARAPGAFTEAEPFDVERKEASISDLGGAAGRKIVEALHNAPGPKKVRYLPGEMKPGDAGEAIGRLVAELGVELPTANIMIKALAGSIGGAADLVRNSTAWRRMTIPERRLVVQSLDDMVAGMEAQGKSEAEILRKIRQVAGDEAAFERFAKSQGIKVKEKVPAAEPKPQTKAEAVPAAKPEIPYRGEESMALTGESPNEGILIHPSTKKPGQWQATTWDTRGFRGDSQHKTRDEAIEEARQYGYDRINPEAFDKAASSRMFQKFPEFHEQIKKHVWGPGEPSGPTIEAQPPKGSEITQPIDKTLSQEEKVKALVKLSKENQPVIEDTVQSMKDAGVFAEWGLKSEEGILGKANRPEKKAGQPWFDVEHIRDALRFRARVKTPEDYQKVAEVLKEKGFEIVEMEPDKVLEPSPWGWRMFPIDLKMPNGQIVEFYMVGENMHQAQEKEGHVIYEEWRGKKDVDRYKNWDAYQAAIERSNGLYNDAWERDLKDFNPDSNAALASLKSSLDSASEAIRKLASKSSGEKVPISQEPLTRTRGSERIPEAKTITRSPLRSTVTTIKEPPFDKEILTDKELHVKLKEGKVPAGVVDVPTKDLHIDPERFQFKREMGAGGVSQKLKEIEKYDPELAGVISVWRDPADGKVYVVNGHHRYELAKRTGYPQMAVQFLRAKNAEEAMRRGAMINIAEGQGSPVDAALIFRRYNMTADELRKKYGISLRGDVAKKGYAISRLHDGILNDVMAKRFPENWAVVIGDNLGNKDAQLAVVDVIERSLKKGKHINVGIVEQMIKDVQGVKVKTAEQASLFGKEITSRPLLVERAELRDYASTALASDKRLFGTVSKKERAKRLAELAGNVIDIKTSQAVADEADTIKRVFDTLASSKGPISDELNEFAERLSNVKGPERAKVKHEFVERLREIVPKIVKGGKRRGPSGSGAPATGRERLAARQVQEEILPAKVQARGGEFGELFKPSKIKPKKEIISPDGTYVDWAQTRIREKDGLRSTTYGLFDKRGTFKKWATKTEIERLKKAQGRPILTLKQEGYGKYRPEARKSQQRGLGLVVEDKTQPGLFPTKKVAAPKEPWEMTSKEWWAAKEAHQVQGHFLYKPTKGTGAQEAARIGALEGLNYGVSVEWRANVLTSKTNRYRQVLDEIILDPVRDRVEHKEVIIKALSEGKPVPDSVLEGYPDLKKLAKPDVIISEPETTAAYSGQVNMQIVARDPDGRYMGRIQYAEFQGKPSVSHVEVEPGARRQGVASKLMDALEAEYPGIKIDAGMLTEDGALFMAARTKKAKPAAGETILAAKKPKSITIYRGENVYNKAGNYYTTDREWARQYTQSGLDSEIRTATIPESRIYRRDPLPQATSVEQFDAAIEEAKAKGYDAVWFDEGPNEPNSIFVINKGALGRAPKIRPKGEEILASRVTTREPTEPAEARTPAPSQKRHDELLKTISDHLRLPIRVGKFRKPGAAGIYKTRSKVARIKRANDIPTAMHEVGHHIQELLGLGGVMPEEVRGLAYEGAVDLDKEGFAEFVRFYVTEPFLAQRRAPNFYETFERALENQAGLQNVLSEIRTAWTTFQSAPAVKKVGSFISRGGKTRNRMSFNKMYAHVKDNLWPIRQVVAAAEDKGHTFKPSEDPYILARLTRGWARKAEQYLKHGTFQYSKDQGVVFTGPSLRDILKPVEEAGEMENLDAYLFAKRAITDPKDRIVKAYEGILSRKDFEQTVEELEPKFKEVAGKLQDYNDQLLKYVLDSGRISEDTYNAIKANNPFYAPLYKIVDGGPPVKGLGQKSGNLFNPIKRMKGSSRINYSPTESLLYNTYTMINSAERARIGKAMVELSQKEGMGGLIENIPFPLKPTVANKEDLVRILGEYDLDIDALADMPPEVILTFRPAYRTGPNEVIFYNNGKPRLYEIGDRELFEALSNINPADLNAAIKIMSYPAKWLRAGATTFSPEFGIRNPARDQLTAWIQSEYGYKPVWDFTKGMYHMLGQTETWQKFNVSGAAHSNIVSIDRDYISKNLKELFKNPVKGLMKNPLEAIQFISEITEEATRVGEVARALKQTGGDFDGLLKSGIAGREVSLDFNRQGGATARGLNMISAFWNARLEGIDKFVRTHKKHPFRTALYGFLGLTLPSVLVWYAQKDDPYYNELPAWRRVLFWNFVFHNPDGTLDYVLSIPKPFEYGLIYGTIPEMALEWAYTKERDTFVEALEQVGKTLDLIPVPTGAVPVIEWFANKSMFFNRPIVPRGKEDLEPVLQSRPGTSETVKLVAKMMDKVPGLKEVASPAKLENLLLGYTAGFGKLALQAGDELIETLGVVDVPPDPEMKYTELPGVRAVFHRFPSANTRSIEQFYDKYTKLKKAWESGKERAGLRGTLLSQMKGVKGKIKTPPELQYYEQAAKTLSVLRKQADMVYKSSIEPKKKREMLDNIYINMMNVARTALQKGKVK